MDTKNLHARSSSKSIISLSFSNRQRSAKSRKSSHHRKNGALIINVVLVCATLAFTYNIHRLLLEPIVDDQVISYMHLFQQENTANIKYRDIVIGAMQKMYHGDHLNKEYAKYIAEEGRDIMQRLPSFYNISLPMIRNDENENDNKKITVRTRYPMICYCVCRNSLLFRYFLKKVVGDIHANYFNMINIFRLNGGLPSKDNPYVFNGDLTDRGDHSIQCLLTALLIKIQCNECLHLLKGNHELSDFYHGMLEKQVLELYDQEIWEIVRDVLNLLPLGIVIEQKVIVMHGGLPSDNLTLQELQSIKRTTDETEESRDQDLIEDIVWTDVMNENGVMDDDERGKSIGPDISRRFLQQNHLQYMIRGHSYRASGFSKSHEGRVVTLHSAPMRDSDHYGAFANIYSRNESIEIERFHGMDKSIEIDWESM
jgi:hypothetical protein